ncbi:MAG: AMP-binding protein [Alphaproteobacteria bacterium]|nr:AMP-binding protein [Alphaproteobacteria bacterium]
MSTVHQLIAAISPDRRAISAVTDDNNPSKPAMTFAALAELMTSTISQLNSIGIGRGDRVAIVLPNGAEMAAAFLAVAAGASAAPLNPAYRADEFDFYMSDLGAKAVIVMAEDDTPAVKVANDRGIPVLVLTPADVAGQFSLDVSAASAADAALPGASQPEDEALVLHTSGTTSRPKVVPLSNANVTASALNISTTLSLPPDDRGLNIMPMFHIHGLIASLLSSMAAGAEVMFTPGFNALKIFQWFDEAKPSWYTAVPTMHQAIVSRAKRNADILDQMKLRFIRSSSSSLPVPVMEDVEATFGCAVIEAYGMTEAAHQMASNPLPPKTRKPGSVGIAAGPDICIMSAEGEVQPTNGIGEICIRGGNVFSGYENNPDANAEAFHGDWFRTGDQGYLDDEGYLRISGRLKEIINRGGEKISPREVDDVLQAHPAVAQIVTFALPHPKLGEEVAAVIVLEDGAVATEAELKEFASAKLADFKVPRVIKFIDEIPKGATGKLQRIGLAEKLGLAEQQDIA